MDKTLAKEVELLKCLKAHLGRRKDGKELLS